MGQKKGKGTNKKKRGGKTLLCPTLVEWSPARGKGRANPHLKRGEKGEKKLLNSSRARKEKKKGGKSIDLA